jgi:hypothetical protein
MKAVLRMLIGLMLARWARRAFTGSLLGRSLRRQRLR